MKLDTITKIEQFLENILLSTEDIPLGVNVVRLAATQDEEGIARMAKSIVVRYTDSSVNITSRIPMTIERTMSFQLIHSSQSYLSESGHDAALQMCAAAYLAINFATPFDCGVEILEPFSLSNESFDGLTDSSHYVYIQTWQVKVLEINRQLIINPCVYAGNCRKLWSSKVGSDRLPGDVLFKNKFYAPVLPPPSIDFDYEEEWVGVMVKGEDLVYIHDSNQVFLYNWQNYTLLSTDTFDESGKFLICSAKDENNDHEFTYFASDFEGRTHLGIQVQGQNIYSLSAHSQLAYASIWPKTTVYVDPTDPEEATEELKFGYVLRIDEKATMEVDGEKFHRANDFLYHKFWIKQDDFVFYPRNHEFPEQCLGLEAENQGPTECA